MERHREGHRERDRGRGGGGGGYKVRRLTLLQNQTVSSGSTERKRFPAVGTTNVHFAVYPHVCLLWKKNIMICGNIFFSIILFAILILHQVGSLKFFSLRFVVRNPIKLDKLKI